MKDCWKFIVSFQTSLKTEFVLKIKVNLNYCIETTVDRNEASELVDKLIDMTAHHLRCLSVVSGFSNLNKTTAYQVADSFLRANNFHLSVAESEIDDIVLLMRDITAGKISLQNIRDWSRKHLTPLPTNLHRPVDSEVTEIIPVDDVKDITVVATKENASLLKL